MSVKGKEVDMKRQLIKDPIHGSLELHPLLIKIIKTPAFHRLKSIKQLSALHYVYPGATHTRYEHSIGVAYLAGEYARMLQRRHAGEIEITDDDVLCVEIAGLCHDLGHGPFSHLFDDILKRHGTKHEVLSQEILAKVIFKELKNDEEDKELNATITRIKTKQNVKKIQQMIHHDETYKADDDGKRLFLYQIVANKSSGIDVDKWDYFIRDCHYMGLQHEFDYKRLMQMSRILKHGRRWQLCYNKREIPSIIGMFRTRCSLHEKGYKHRRGIAMNYMISTAISEVLDIKLITNEAEEELSINNILRSLKTLKGLKGYLRLNDGILHVIENKKKATLKAKADQEKLAKAKKMISRLHNDEYFTPIKAESDVKKGPKVACAVKDIVKKLGKRRRSGKLSEEDIFCKKIKLSYGSEGKVNANPCKRVLIYDENEGSTSTRFMKKADIDPLFRPQLFGREKIKYYCSENVTDQERKEIESAICEQHGSRL